MLIMCLSLCLDGITLLRKKIILKVGIAKLEEFAEFSEVIGCVYLLAFLLFGIAV